MQSVPVRVGVDGHARDPGVPAGPGDADSDLATIGDEHLAHDAMSISSKAGGIVFGLYFALCGVVALLVALRDRAPAGLGRILLISVAVVHGLLGAFAWGLVGPGAFVFMVVVLALVVLLLMTYDRQEGPSEESPEPPPGKDPAPALPPAAPSPS
jgi:hypothetical protein